MGQLQPLQKAARRPGGTLSEVFPDTAPDAGSSGFVLSALGPSAGPILWIQDHLSQCEAGRPYLPGLGRPNPVIEVSLSRSADVLWAMEEGLRCATLSAVIGEVWGDPPVLGFTATKRLALRAEAGGVPCWLIRRGCVPGLSAARERWRIASLPSDANADNPQAPGQPRWRAELFRSRSARPGIWVASHDGASSPLDFTALRDNQTLPGNQAMPGERVIADDQAMSSGQMPDPRYAAR